MTPLRLGLPLLQGAHHLEFRCNECGNCCRALRVALTHVDLRRLVHGLGRAPDSIVEWLPPDGVDMTGEPSSFVELREGRRLMVLAQREGACHLLDARQRCSAYEHRPRDCRQFPFDLTRDDAGRVSRVSRLDLEGCGDDRGEPADLDQLASSDELRWQELRDYHAQVERWNRLAGHRRRFRQRLGDPAEFFTFLSIPTSP